MDQTLESNFYNDTYVLNEFNEMKKDIINGKISPVVATEKLIEIFRKTNKKKMEN